MYLNVRIAGHLDARWSEWFEGLALRHLVDGSTEMTGTVVDQAALYGLLQRAQDLGLTLLAVAVKADGSEDAGTEPAPGS